MNIKNIGGNLDYYKFKKSQRQLTTGILPCYRTINANIMYALLFLQKNWLTHCNER